MMYYRIHESGAGLLIAVADEDLIGKTLKHGDIEFFVNPRFYKSQKADHDRMVEILKDAVNINLVGKEAVQAGKDAGMVNEKNIIMIGDIPHAQAVVMIL